ncbi:LysR substrate-binding domain-containing protein [Methylobacterium trifolii]|uniref:Octopine catabolism/uptake operon regulatory protein OccR n=1 Tax=Methylobacterium trifolii TaxID=1003092 RepID=A0ABQ4TY00_9HYPH|nr:LysR substrate-binding domain-containing protein [Methylobacterium trifolii]GJE59583.1 Octopine catabolism/uptake operon regulatory protein OccR [Methylobacterium trifolii]
MLNFRQLEIFRAVMIARTVSGAARMLNTSQPGLSRMLRHMEDRLGFLLFDRAGGRLTPTQEAKLLFSEAERVHKGLETLHQFIDQMAQGTDDMFRVGASPSLGHSIVPKILKVLSGHFPRLVVQVDILSVDQVPEYLGVQTGEYTLAVFPVDHPNVESERIGSGAMVCVVPSDHPWASRRRIGLRDLVGQPLVSFRSDTPHGRVIAGMYAQAGLAPEISTFVRFAETACAFVRNGFGVTLVDAFTARACLGGTAILEVEEAGEMPVYLHRNRLAARSRMSDVFEAEARRHARCI